jgi:hypothetical protein
MPAVFSPVPPHGKGELSFDEIILAKQINLLSFDKKSK